MQGVYIEQGIVIYRGDDSRRNGGGHVIRWMEGVIVGRDG